MRASVSEEIRGLQAPGSQFSIATVPSRQLNTNISVRTGFPLTVRASSDTSGTGENTTRANQVADPFAGVDHTVTAGQPVQWINRTTDPVNLAIAALLLIAASAIAAFIPARHASRVDPMVALCTE